MTGKPLKVMIVGAGTGGLCLAQGLKLNNVSVELFERDYSSIPPCGTPLHCIEPLCEWIAERTS